MACNWRTVELQLNEGGRAKFQTVQCSKNNKITNKTPFYTFPDFGGVMKWFGATRFSPRNAPGGAT
jgi:hypothetical protein